MGKRVFARFEFKTRFGLISHIGQGPRARNMINMYFKWYAHDWMMQPLYMSLSHHSKKIMILSEIVYGGLSKPVHSFWDYLIDKRPTSSFMWFVYLVIGGMLSVKCYSLGIQPFWYCRALLQNFKTIGHLIRLLWSNEISRDLSSRWVSDGYPICTAPLTFQYTGPVIRNIVMYNRNL